MSETPRHLHLPKLLVLFIIMLAAIFLLAAIRRMQTVPETDNAYVYADTINIAPEVHGRIINLPVKDNQYVRKGDLLFQIDPRPYQQALADARSRLDALNEQITLTQRTVNAQTYNAESVQAAVERAKAVAVQTRETRIRVEPLLPEGFASAEEVDQARTAERAAQADLDVTLKQAQQAQAAISGVDALVAQRAGLEAQVAIAELHLEFTEVRAPFNGRLVSLKTTVGQYASPARPIFTLIDAGHWYVIANFRETDLKNISPGTRAELHILANTGKSFQGYVDSIGYGVLPDDGGAVIEGLPFVRRTINWVHVSQRFPVKIAVTDPDPDLFRIGASAAVRLYPSANKQQN